jgi:hypothetical protein
MPIFCVNSILKLLNLYKIGNPQKHFISHVIKFLVLLVMLVTVLHAS